MATRIEAFKGVVKFPVVSAELRIFLDNEGGETLVCERQGRGDAGKTAANDEDCMVDAKLARFQGL